MTLDWYCGMRNISYYITLHTSLSIDAWLLRASLQNTMRLNVDMKIRWNVHSSITSTRPSMPAYTLKVLSNGR